MVKKTVFLPFTLSLLLTACSAETLAGLRQLAKETAQEQKAPAEKPAPQATPAAKETPPAPKESTPSPSPEEPPQQGVTVTIPVSTAELNPQGKITIRVYNPPLAPGAVVTREPVENHTFAVAEVQGQLILSLARVKVGDTIEIRLGSSDKGDCNSASISYKVHLTSKTMTLEKQHWTVQDLACIHFVSLAGTVRDESAKTLVGARIAARSLVASVPYQREVKTAADGRFEIINAPEGVEIELTVSLEGYTTQRRAIVKKNTPESAGQVFDFTLKPSQP